MMTNLQQEIKNVLDQFPNYWDNGVLLKNQVIEDVRNYHPELLAALLKNQTIKKSYSLEVNGLHIFKVEDFVSMLRYKNYLENSYTKYTNEIGLTSEGKYLKYGPDVVLDFPHKDSVIEGGMAKENLGKDEIYYHNILAKEEIDTLFSPKILMNIKKYNSGRFHEVTKFNDKDNLIIKGNNLITLHSLKERYENKVKMIYIDPPYNTGNDSFKYNDRFNHSTWLTFIKNRLEVAKKLLKEDGSIFIQCDDNEQAYIKVLMDELFGEKNFISTIVYRRRKSQANLSKNISPIHDYILIYGKSDQVSLNNIIAKIDDSAYKNPDKDPRGPYVTMPTTNRGGSKYKIKTPSGNTIEDEWRFKKETFDNLLKDNRIIFPKQGKGKPRYKQFLKDKREQGVVTNTWWDDVPTNQDANKEINKLFDKDMFSYPKAEGLIKRILELGSNEGDIILDFFMGSATTQAVAMKMNRQFIGIEQMDYINTVSVPRLQKVIQGEQGGISKDVEWQGGGDFVYAELFELNQIYIKDIQRASNATEIGIVIQTIKASDFLNIKVDIEKILQQKEAFFELTLEEQKFLLIQVLDNNQLYLGYSEIDDEQYAIDEQTKSFNRSFYQEGV